MDLLDRTLGEIARSIPNASALLDAHGFDFCCGGANTLRSVTQDRGMDVEELLRDLEALHARPVSDERDWAKANANELIDHILTRYHARHRQQLPELIRLAQTVERVHADNPDCPRGLALRLERMKAALEQHMEKEEGILFPMLRQGFPPFARGPIGVMRSEHDQHGEALGDLVALTRGFKVPAEACDTWRALMLGLQTLRADLMQHIHLENNVLFEER
jgi:regulator of cell morphogenesis and NO signaling